MTEQRRRIAATGWVQVCSAIERDSPTRMIDTGHGRGAFAVNDTGVWIANRASHSIARLDPRTFELTSMLEVRKIPVAIAPSADAIWSVCSNGWLWRIWPDGPRVEGVAQLGWRARALAVTGQSLWVLREGGQLTRLDPSTGEVVSETKVPGGARRMIATNSALWLTCKRGRRIVRVDCESGLPDADIAFPRRAVSLAVAGDRLLVGCAKRLSPRLGWLYEIDRKSPSLGPAIELPDQPRAIAAGLESIWLACSHGRRKGTIERFDPQTGKLESWLETDWPVGDLTLVGDSLLLATSLASGAPDGGMGAFDGGSNSGLTGGSGGNGG